jgi:YD repeat-containing protein
MTPCYPLSARLSTVGTSAFSAGGDTTYFSYNSRDLITRIESTEPGFTPNESDYNALGQRTRITDSTGTTYFV